MQRAPRGTNPRRGQSSGWADPLLQTAAKATRSAAKGNNSNVIFKQDMIEECSTRWKYRNTHEIDRLDPVLLLIVGGGSNVSALAVSRPGSASRYKTRTKGCASFMRHTRVNILHSRRQATTATRLCWCIKFGRFGRAHDGDRYPVLAL